MEGLDVWYWANGEGTRMIGSTFGSGYTVTRVSKTCLGKKTRTGPEPKRAMGRKI
jgi:hypothetical protein